MRFSVLALLCIAAHALRLPTATKPSTKPSTSEVTGVVVPTQTNPEWKAITDFEHLEQRDLICIISALEHNTWFTKLRASLAVVAKSPSLQELHLSSAGVRWEFFQRLAGAMGSNQYCNLNTLDISLNFVEDRGLISIANVLAHFPRGTR